MSLLMTRTRRTGILNRLIIVLFSCVAVAFDDCRAATIQMLPTSQLASLGTVVEFDVTISGLQDKVAPSLGAFDFDVSFDPGILSFQSIVFGEPNLGSLLGPLRGSMKGFHNNQVTGTINQFEVSLELPDTLDDMQPDSFTLTRLRFGAVGIGTSNIRIFNVILGDAIGEPLQADVVGQSAAVIVARSGVPDSGSTVVLLALALLGISVTRSTFCTTSGLRRLCLVPEGIMAVSETPIR